MKKIYVLLFLIFFSFVLKAQKQNYNWFFGNLVGLTWQTKEIKKLEGLYGTPDDFLTDLPTYRNGSFSTLEGTFTISDLNGELIFYSNGFTLYNKNQVAFASNLGGDTSSAQSGTIALYPGSLNKNVVITASRSSQNGLFYTILDKELNNGLGGVVPNPNGTPATLSRLPFIGQQGFLSETVTVGRHSNKKDLWVLAPGRGILGNEFNTFLNVWLMTEENVMDNTNTAHSSLPVDLITDTNVAGGYIKFSNNSKHFAWINFGSAASNSSPVALVYGDFDNTTGQISNIRIKTGLKQYMSQQGYGVEFTNDNKFLYVSLTHGSQSGGPSAILVFDFDELLAANTPVEVASVDPIKEVSAIWTGNNPQSDVFGALQSGPDGRIYSANLSKQSLLIIDNPKDPNNLRMYKYPLANGTLSNWGLPNFSVPWFNVSIEIPDIANSICINNPFDINFYVSDGDGFEDVSRISVDYGDGTEVFDLTPVILEPNNPVYTLAGIHYKAHAYRQPGIYVITVTAYDLEDNFYTSFDRTVIINSCGIKVNPNIRGEFNL